MWYVLDASKDAKLVYGLKQDCTKEEIRKAIANGTVMKYLQKVPIHKDDLFFIQAGTVHAIGAGALVAEIQESSNLTYRLYDYDRVGKDGKKRELHIDKALDVANLKSSAEPKQPLRVLKYRQGIASELLTRCKYFEVYRMIVNTERRQIVTYLSDQMSFRVLLCVSGCGNISYPGGQITFYKGDCIFVPANWPERRKLHWCSLLTARAIENQVYVAGINCVGTQDGLHYSGDSRFIAPDGTILQDCRSAAGCFVCDLSAKTVAETRQTFPVQKDRRPDFYRSILL